MGQMTTIDGNEAVAYSAYLTNEVIAIYPITPSSPMGEWADQWMSEGRLNIWETAPHVSQMQSEAGVAGAIHGSLQTGALSTTFTASQGLLLMIPNLYKIAGELTSCVIHVAARTVATHALSIFGDHSDVMACRQTGFGLIASGSVQEAMDLALISQAASLESRIPIIHFFDGFRTSHEVSKVEQPGLDQVREMISDDLVRAHRARALTPDSPLLRGTAQNPDVFFQAREACNPFYTACPSLVQQSMDQFAELTGRRYNLFDYIGAEDADRVIILMGSGAEVAHETIEKLTDEGEKVGLLKVRLYRPWDENAFFDALPKTVKKIAVLDRTKEPGSPGEPLYLDVVTSMQEASSEGRLPFGAMPRIIGGRYGLSSKDFTPAMVKGVFDELDKGQPKNHFTVGINDDVSHTSIHYDPAFSAESDETVRAVFFGLGSDGTVGANKNSIKIIGEETDNYAQGYFVYDSKKSGSMTTSHLRFGPKPIRSSYLISRANFVACHQFGFLETIDVLKMADEGATFLLNSPHGPEEVWDHLPREVQEQIIQKKLKFYTIDAVSVAEQAGMGRRINTVMQTCFFAISGVLPRDEAIAKIKESIKKTYGKRGEAVVQKNYAAVDAALEHLHEVQVPQQVSSSTTRKAPVPANAPDFVRNLTGKIIAGYGDELPVSALPVDGTFPTGTTKYEKRNIALDIPIWDADVCIQCGKCSLVCPHGVIRGKVYEPEMLKQAPDGFKSAKNRDPNRKDMMFTLQISPDDCTGCTLCVEVCPAKNKQQAGLKAINMEGKEPHIERERESWDFFKELPVIDRSDLNQSRVKDVQLLETLFEFSGACAGCGETPYVKLLSQLFGDRALIANATGCSSIYGGNLPTTPWTTDDNGRGPAWSNSLFEDNAEFGFGMRLTLDKQIEYACELLQQLSGTVGDNLVEEIIHAEQKTEEDLLRQRGRVQLLKEKLEGNTDQKARNLYSLADTLVKKSVWILGGDGWAYDIGYGGLDHVLASGRDVNVLVLDTEVYSNTGGQQSKATPRAAVAKFAAGGKPSAKKDLAMLAMTYGNIYVARVAMGSNDVHTIKAFNEAESYPGPSLILAYSHCIAHGYDLALGMNQQKLAVQSGYWPLMRYNPLRANEGKNPLQLDSKPPKIPLKDFVYNETRYRMLAHSKPDDARELLKKAQEDVDSRWKLYQHLASMPADGNGAEAENDSAKGAK